MPVLPLVGSMMTVFFLFWRNAGASRVLNHRHADAILDAAARLKKFRT